MQINKVFWTDFQNNLLDFMQYAFKTSDKFSILLQTNYPYSTNNIKYCEEQLVSDLGEYLINQIFPGNKYYKKVPKHSVLNIYQCKKESFHILFNNNAFMDNAYSDNLSFFRSDTVWLNCIFHENEALLMNSIPEDILFMQKHNIKFYTCDAITGPSPRG